MTARERARMRRLETLLAEARDAINGELTAAGLDEVRQHPSLQARSRLEIGRAHV